MTLENHNHPDEAEIRLSAYAFGELEGEELAAMEIAVAADPTLAAKVAELRAFGAGLAAVLGDEPAASPEGRTADPASASAQVAASAARGAEHAPARGRLLRFPIWMWSAAGAAAAASVALMVTTREATFSASEGINPTRPPAQVKPVTAPSPELRVSFNPEASAAPPPPSAPLTVSVRASREGEDLLGLTRPDAPAPLPIPASLPPMPARPAGRQMGSTLANGSGIGGLGAGIGTDHDPATGRDSEAYASIHESGFISAAAEPLSTFSIDVDTASYSNVRRFLRSGQLPPRDAVRVEELVNYFPYRYAPPPPDRTAVTRSAAPFAAHLAVVSAPWEPRHRLVRVALKGRELAPESRPPANLVFLVDVSGSMSAANKLPLVKASLRRLLGQLRRDDRVAIVTYAGASGLALPSTPVAQEEEILAALERLESGGSTNGGMGIHLAYDVARSHFREDGLNRVILCTDGDFNVGVTGRDALLALVREKARGRVFLTVLGFGMGNLKDATLELLADKGDGAYAYIDSEREAHKVFVEQAQGSLATIAKDVKIQVEFNPAQVASYRLIGYENRALRKEDFNNDRVDAGEVGAGHTITVLYEIVPIGRHGGADDHEAEERTRPTVDPLKYGPKTPDSAPAAATAPASPPAASSGDDELLTVKIRYKAPDADLSRKLEFPLVDRGASFAAADEDLRFAAAVAAWGMLLRESPHAGDTSFHDVLRWAEAGLGSDAQGHRAEFLDLVRLAARLRGEVRE